MPYNFPEIIGDELITTRENKIICFIENAKNSFEVNLDKVEYAYIILSANSDKIILYSLFLFDHYQNYLPTHIKGFKEAYDFIASK